MPLSSWPLLQTSACLYMPLCSSTWDWWLGPLPGSPPLGLARAENGELTEGCYSEGNWHRFLLCITPTSLRYPIWVFNKNSTLKHWLLHPSTATLSLCHLLYFCLLWSTFFPCLSSSSYHAPRRVEFGTSALPCRVGKTWLCQIQITSLWCLKEIKLLSGKGH